MLKLADKFRLGRDGENRMSSSLIICISTSVSKIYDFLDGLIGKSQIFGVWQYVFESRSKKIKVIVTQLVE